MAAATSRSTAARPGPRRTIPPRSSITSRPPKTFRITSAARSRTTPRSACRAKTAATRRRSARARGQLAVRRGRRRERLHRARIRRIPTSFYAGSQGALLTRYDRRTGYTRDIQVYPLFFSGMPASDAEGALAVDFPDRVLAASIRTCSTPRRSICGGPPTKARAGRSISPGSDAQRSEDAGRFRRPDHEGSERPRDLRHHLHHRALAQRCEHDLDRLGRRPGLHHARRRQELEEHHAARHARIQPHQPDRSLAAAAGRAYVAAKKYQMDDRRPYIFRTADYGKTWTKIVNGIPARRFRARRPRRSQARRACCSPERNTAFMFRSTMARKWQSLRLNLPDTQVSDLVVEENDLVIATHGRRSTCWTISARCGRLKPEILERVRASVPAACTCVPFGQGSIDYYLKTAG